MIISIIQFGIVAPRRVRRLAHSGKWDVCQAPINARPLPTNVDDVTQDTLTLNNVRLMLFQSSVTPYLEIAKPKKRRYPW